MPCMRNTELQYHKDLLKEISTNVRILSCNYFSQVTPSTVYIISGLDVLFVHFLVVLCNN